MNRCNWGYLFPLFRLVLPVAAVPPPPPSQFQSLYDFGSLNLYEPGPQWGDGRNKVAVRWTASISGGGVAHTPYGECVCMLGCCCLAREIVKELRLSYNRAAAAAVDMYSSCKSPPLTVVCARCWFVPHPPLTPTQQPSHIHKTSMPSL